MTPLLCHKKSEPPNLEVEGSLSWSVESSDATLSFVAKGADVVWPARKPRPQRVEGLYRRTCFEWFLKLDDRRYLEWNFSPSGDWCGFSFASYREASAEFPADCFKPKHFYASSEEMTVHVDVDLSFLSLEASSFSGFKSSLCAVIEQGGGALSYWSQVHMDPKKPDFHLF